MLSGNLTIDPGNALTLKHHRKYLLSASEIPKGWHSFLEYGLGKKYSRISYNIYILILRLMGDNNFMVKDCIFCQEIEDIKHNKIDPFFVTELKTGYVSLGHNQYYRGYCLFISKIHASELHKLDSEFKKQFLIEMALVGEVIHTSFQPKKINIELLGNSHPHLHWHIIPRYKHDILPKIPVWNNSEFLKNKKRPSESQLNSLKKVLLYGFDTILKG